MSKPKKMPEFARLLRRAREQMDLTQEQLARMMDLPVTTLQKWEQQTNLPDFSMVGKLINWFGRDAWWILYAAGVEPPALRAMCEGFLEAQSHHRVRR